jgi:hypothetical protein
VSKPSGQGKPGAEFYSRLVPWDRLEEVAESDRERAALAAIADDAYGDVDVAVFNAMLSRLPLEEPETPSDP